MFLRSHADGNFISNRTHTTYGDNVFCNSLEHLIQKLFALLILPVLLLLNQT